MKAWRRAVSALAIAAVLALLLPATVAAKPGFEVQNRALHLEMSARTANGYFLAVTTNGHREVSLMVSRGNVLALYTTSGRVSRDRIEADFGDVGRLAVRFDGVRRRFNPLAEYGIQLPPGIHLPHRECHGRAPEREVGSFRGTIAFNGEQGFTTLDARRARGEVHRFYHRVCRRPGRPARLDRRPHHPPKLEPHANLLVAIDHQPGRTVSFEALGFEFNDAYEELESLLGSVGFAAIRERRQGVRILRTANAEADAGSFLLSPRRAKTQTATVAFPKPLYGTAEFRKAPGAPASWAGALTAWLPGAGTVALTGPGFTATLCRPPLQQFNLSNRCLRRSGAVMPAPFVVGSELFAQISGSQSQLFGDARLSWSR